MLLFVSFLIVTINYTKAFRVKNEVLSILEREEGLTSRTTITDLGAMQLINNYLLNNGQTAMGTCDKDWLGVYSLETNLDFNSISEKVQTPGSRKYYYCIKKNDSFTSSKTEKYKAYYEVRLFLKFELSVFGNLFTYGINGETNDIQYPGDCKTWGKC